MNGNTLPTALERLIQPLSNDLKAAMLEAWKNEDIPHDENDSVYRLMVLLTLYARLYDDIATNIAAAAIKINQVQQTHLTEVRATYAKQSEQNQELNEDLKYIHDRIAEVRQVMDEKPKSLRSQFESEMKTLFSDLRREGREMISEFASYTRRFKDDCEEWRARAYFAFLIGGLFIGIGGTLIVWGVINYHGN